MNNQLSISLSDRYEVVRPLGNGAFGTVYLVRHKSLETERAIKIIPKSASDRLTVLSEARLLKSIQHPGIPILYDIEEDTDNFYLVEEFVQGESLDAYLLHQAIISQNFYLQCAIQLCDIYQYLHTLSTPMLYQDLKPAHIIVCGNQIKLIDFGALYPLAKLGNNINAFGNMDFSAPEFLRQENISLQSDLYPIGKMLEYMSKYLEVPISKAIQSIIKKATEVNPLSRYETVGQLRNDLLQLSKNFGATHLAHKIVVVSTHSGCGATHFSMALTSTLNYMGNLTYYMEDNTSNALRTMREFSSNIWEKEGCLGYKWFLGYPKYGPGIQISDKESSANYVIDVGDNYKSEVIAEADYIILICSAAPWHLKETLQYREFVNANKSRIRMVCFPKQPEIARYLAQEFSLPIYPFFYDPDAFDVTREKQLFVTKLLDIKGRFLLFSRLKSIVFRIRKP